MQLLNVSRLRWKANSGFASGSETSTVAIPHAIVHALSANVGLDLGLKEARRYRYQGLMSPSSSLNSMTLIPWHQYYPGAGQMEPFSRLMPREIEFKVTHVRGLK